MIQSCPAPIYCVLHSCLLRRYRDACHILPPLDWLRSSEASALGVYAVASIERSDSCSSSHSSTAWRAVRIRSRRGFHSSCSGA